MRLFIAGWKPVSLTDVYGHCSFTLWLCGCNLRCPFCHNWRIASWDGRLCRHVGVADIVRLVEMSANLVDYVHVTGGEPLLQHIALRALLSALNGLGCTISLNSNLTLPDRLEPIIEFVDHVATDLKPEWALGVRINYIELFTRSLDVIREHGVTLELRIPVFKTTDVREVVELYKRVEPHLDKRRTYVVVNAIVGPPITDVRDKQWCKEHCNPSKVLVDEVAEALRRVGARVVGVRYNMPYY